MKPFSLVLNRVGQRWFYILLSVLTAVGVILGNVQTTHAFSWFDILRRGVQIIQLSSLSDQQEVELGRQINQELLKQVRLYPNPQINRYVEQIGQRLVAQSDRPNLPYTFQIVEDDSINAFATMGGFVYVHTGLMKVAENEAELASVIAHEIGHITGRHAVEQMRQQAIAQGVLTATGLDNRRAVQIGVELALRRPNSREDEFEADSLGLAMHHQAGYAPSAVVSFMQKLQQQQGRNLPSFLSTHPATDDRVKVLQAKVDELPTTSGAGLNAQAYRQKIRPLL